MLNGKLVLGYCPIGNGSMVNPFDRIFDLKQDISKSIENVDAVVFWGGRDINPELYGDEPHPMNQASGDVGLSPRDEFEWKAMAYCIANNIPIIGVCRGAQMACAKAGGWLIQHVDRHGASHLVKTSDGELFNVTSCHHQMMYPYEVDHELLAWSHTNLSGIYEGPNGNSVSDYMKNHKEPEIVFFPRIRALAIQGHPEWVERADNSRFVSFCNEQVASKLLQLVN